MAAFGVPEANIARVVGIDPKTLRKHYREELDTGQTKATAKVAESLFRKALGDGSQFVTAAIFWLKTRGGWRENNELTVTATLSSELPIMSHEEWEQRCALPAAEEDDHLDSEVRGVLMQPR